LFYVRLSWSSRYAAGSSGRRERERERERKRERRASSQKSRQFQKAAKLVRASHYCAHPGP
jgi:hypothetical protein